MLVAVLPDSQFRVRQQQTHATSLFFGGIVNMWVFRVQVKHFIVSLPRDIYF